MLFSRRVLQSLLDETREILPLGVRRSFAASFNAGGVSSLADEWELALVGAFRGIGALRYEPSLPGTTKLDLMIEPPDMEAFCVEITAVSDRDSYGLSPLDWFTDEVRRRIRKACLHENQFHMRLGSKIVNRGRKHKLALAIPRSSDSDFFAQLDSFMLKILDAPRREDYLEYKASELEIRLSYDPSRTSFGGSYGAFDLPASTTDNSVYRALEKKAKQIRRSDFGGVAGIALCDAGDPLFSPLGPSSVQLRDVVGLFLKRRPEVSFVTVFSTGANGALIGKKPLLGVFPNANAATGSSESLLTRLTSLREALPILQRDSMNCRSFPEELRGKEGLCFGGGPAKLSIERDRTSVVARISSRRLIEVLGDKQPLRRMRVHGDLTAFEDACKHGARLVDVRFIAGDENDDDWLEFKFASEPDPAVSPIVAND